MKVYAVPTAAPWELVCGGDTVASVYRASRAVWMEKQRLPETPIFMIALVISLATVDNKAIAALGSWHPLQNQV